MIGVLTGHQGFNRLRFARGKATDDSGPAGF